MIAEALVYPLEMTRRQLQVESIAMGRLIGDSAMRRTVVTMQQIVAKNGVAGLYRGILPSLMQVIPSAALSYMTYNYLKALSNAL